MHALIIEDEPRIAEMIGKELALLGYGSIDVADTQAEGIAAAD